jgi:putative flavoprotein involved in K+ transport
VTDVPGLYVVGLPWLYTWGSGRFSGIARDVEYLAELIELGAAPPGSRQTPRPAADVVG